MQTAIKTLLKDISYAKEAARFEYSNGVTKGINNFIKVIKRIAFVYKSFILLGTEYLLQGNLK